MTLMTAEGVNPGDWIGRREATEGRLTREGAGMLAATLSHPAAPLPDTSDGAVMPPLWHWGAFNAYPGMDELGPDGHPRLGGFLPPVPLERRMWAAGDLTFTGQLRIGETLHRSSEIAAVTRKQGAAGSMVFVTVAHVTEGAEGRIEERQDIVYLAIPPEYRPPARQPAPEAPLWAEPVEMTEARLFRYSACTFNAHRIHYDLAYTREVERYPALVVHGPMQATLLIEAAVRHTGRRPRRFRFRGIHPLFLGDGLRLVAAPAETGLTLCTVAEAGHQCLHASFEGEPA